MTSTATPQDRLTRCDANSLGRAATDWGEDALPCQVRTGLRSFVDRQGLTRFYCGSLGHEANAKRRFGVQTGEAERVARAIERISAAFDEEVEFDIEGQPEFNGSFR